MFYLLFFNALSEAVILSIFESESDSFLRSTATTASGALDTKRSLAQASADMADPEKKTEWKEVAANSNGKYKTPRGAAFASYYNRASGIE